MVELRARFLMAAQGILIPLCVSGILAPFALLPGSALLALTALGKRREMSDAEVLLLVKEIRRHGGSLREALGSAIARRGESAAELRVQLSRFRLGEFELRNRGHSNAMMRELLGTIAHGLSTGRSVSNGLELLERRLEERIRTRERMRSRIGSLQYTTLMGMAFFLPLFGGISSAILASSAGVLSGGSTPYRQGFICIVACYILAVLLIDDRFRNPEKGLQESLMKVLPTFSISSFVLLASANYIGYAV